ncbi:hypothetical protein Pan44_51520 [Caulifigura coniformis]|uniref:Uncharacterized protein n=2 Tax=Caulifigura coniformis TaxID=2527983 RepID=A0A517SLT1_9PLAN|nr:hypothetical protein Pan44_51520 [Caulifigura coniformis]
MNDPIDLILSGKGLYDVLSAHLALSDEERRNIPAKVDEEQFPAVATYIKETCGAVQVQEVLIQGGKLDLFLLVTDKEGRRAFFDDMLEDLDLSRTQGYRCIGAYRRFGGELLNAGKLQKRFCGESLKILAEERTPPAAREEALALARSGERITIKRAEELRQKHGMVPVVPAAPPMAAVEADRPKRKAARAAAAKWTFKGSVVRIQVIPTTGSETPDVPDVICDLQSAIDQLRNGSTQLVA